MTSVGAMKMHFSDYFDVDPSALESYGAFNISIINDLPLFIDPFLLFNSEKQEYKALHDQIIRYLRFLRDKSLAGQILSGLLMAGFAFPEVKQTWLGFSVVGNSGRGLSRDFALALNANLNTIFSNFGNEQITRGSHLEKLALIKTGVGRDKISDFTTNLMKDFLLRYTQEFALAHLREEFLRPVAVPNVRFNYETETWQSETYSLPYRQADYVILSPKDLLTKDEIWINRADLVNDYDRIVQAVPNDQLRAQLNNYLLSVLPRRPTVEERKRAINRTIRQYPQIIEYYIRGKEESGDLAESISEEHVNWSDTLFVRQTRDLASLLFEQTKFYEIGRDTVTEAKARLEVLKDVIENKGGWRVFYVKGEPLRREKDLHIMYRLTWFATPSDVSREVNDGRGPADFKISRGSADKSIVEFKLASNPQLQRNLQAQVEIYKQASDADKGLKAILYFSEYEYGRVLKILRDLGLQGDPNIVLIDARSDNKPSGSDA